MDNIQREGQYQVRRKARNSSVVSVILYLLLSKVTKTGTRDVAQEVEHMPSLGKAPNSIPGIYRPPE